MPNLGCIIVAIFSTAFLVANSFPHSTQAKSSSRASSLYVKNSGLREIFPTSRLMVSFSAQLSSQYPQAVQTLGLNKIEFVFLSATSALTLQAPTQLRQSVQLSVFILTSPYLIISPLFTTPRSSLPTKNSSLFAKISLFGKAYSFIVCCESAINFAFLSASSSSFLSLA